MICYKNRTLGAKMGHLPFLPYPLELQMQSGHSGYTAKSQYIPVYFPVFFGENSRTTDYMLKTEKH